MKYMLDKGKLFICTFERYSWSTLYTMAKLHSDLNMEWLLALLNFRHILQSHFEPVVLTLLWEPLVSDLPSSNNEDMTVVKLHTPQNVWNTISASRPMKAFCLKQFHLKRIPILVRSLNPNANLAWCISFCLTPYENKTACYSSVRRKWKAEIFLST